MSYWHKVHVERCQNSLQMKPALWQYFHEHERVFKAIIALFTINNIGPAKIKFRLQNKESQFYSFHLFEEAVTGSVLGGGGTLQSFVWEALPRGRYWFD